MSEQPGSVDRLDAPGLGGATWLGAGAHLPHKPINKRLAWGLRMTERRQSLLQALGEAASQPAMLRRIVHSGSGANVLHVQLGPLAKIAVALCQPRRHPSSQA